MLVLIVDDDPMARLLCSRMVATLGYETLTAMDGESAWGLYQQRSPDVIISDWMMPGMDGLALCQAVRGAPGPSYTYLVLLSSLSERADVLRGMRAGADDYLTKPLDREQLQVRLLCAERVTGLHRELAAQRAELLRLNERLYNEGRRDALTGLGNRLRLREDLQTLAARSERHGQRYSMAILDVDHFKKYNDTCGHQAGDDILREVGALLQAQCRGSDSAYRYGGEEFLVLMAETDVAQARAAAERWQRALAEAALPHPGLTPPGLVTVSVGVAELVGARVTETLRAADAALYEAKAAGRNCVRMASPLPPLDTPPPERRRSGPQAPRLGL